MHWQHGIVLAAAALTAPAAAHRSLRHVGRSDDRLEARSLFSPEDVFTSINAHVERRATAEHQFLNSNTSRFVVNGTGIPDVDFDVGESYAGQLPISSNPNDTNQFFWWFFPSTNPAASKEILIWLNGGPGCSSLEGLLQENGPFIWQPGTYRPLPNTWAWSNLTNVVYIEQPIGTGFSTGNVTATSEEDVAAQFLGFWKNFVDTFSMQGYKVYITGESYAGMYCPYIAGAMVDAADETYYNISGVMIYDPVIGQNDIMNPIPAVAFVDYWTGLFPLNDSFIADIHSRDAKCGYSNYLNKYLVYPPAGPQPVIVAGQDASGNSLPECESIYYDIADAAFTANPCFNYYQVSTTCPTLWDVLGFPGSFSYTPPGANIYFAREDVKKAINAPMDVEWSECSDGNVFVDGLDSSDPSGFSVLPKVIDATKNVIIGHGALDYVLIANGTLLTIQNMTWGGKLGFQSPPIEPLNVPAHDDPIIGAMAGSGVMGTVHSERGLTYVGVDISGHMVPQYAPSVAYRNVELLLGRISSLSEKGAFTTDPDVPQPSGDLGNGTAPQGFSDESSTSNNTSTTTVKASGASQGSAMSMVTKAGMWVMPLCLAAVATLL